MVQYVLTDDGSRFYINDDGKLVRDNVTKEEARRRLEQERLRASTSVSAPAPAPGKTAVPAQTRGSVRGPASSAAGRQAATTGRYSSPARQTASTGRYSSSARQTASRTGRERSGAVRFLQSAAFAFLFILASGAFAGILGLGYTMVTQKSPEEWWIAEYMEQRNGGAEEAETDVAEETSEQEDGTTSEQEDTHE